MTFLFFLLGFPCIFFVSFVHTLPSESSPSSPASHFLHFASPLLFLLLYLLPHPYIPTSFCVSHSPGFASLPTASCITSVLSNIPLLFSPPAHPVLCISGAHACTPPAAVGLWALKCNWEPLFFLEKCPRWMWPLFLVGEDQRNLS